LNFFPAEKETTMRIITITAIVLAALLCAASNGAPRAARSSGGDAAKSPPLFPRDREIALALGAAPAHVAEQAGVYALESNGYVKVRDSKNGFNCLVEREAADSLEPECLDAEGSETTLPVFLREGELRAQGKGPAEIEADIAAGYNSGKYRAPRRPGIVYMLSTENRVVVDPETGRVAPFGPHLMFYAPYLTNRDIGSRMGAGDRVFIISEGTPRALMIVPVPAAKPGDAHH
jgi:hypothetical protein